MCYPQGIFISLRPKKGLKMACWYKKYHKTSIDSHCHIREIAVTLMLQRRNPNPHVNAVTI